MFTFFKKIFQELTNLQQFYLDEGIFLITNVVCNNPPVGSHYKLNVHFFLSFSRTNQFVAIYLNEEIFFLFITNIVSTNPLEEIQLSHMGV